MGHRFKEIFDIDKYRDAIAISSPIISSIGGRFTVTGQW